MKNELFRLKTINKSLFPSRRFLTWLAILLMTLALHPATEAQTYTDSTFNNSDWTSTVLPVSTAGTSSTSGKNTGSGNPAPSRITSHSFGPGQIQVAHLNATAFYDPAVQGAITSLSYAYDLIHYNPPTGAAFGFSIIVFQNNTYYRSLPADAVLSGSWQAFGKSGLTAESFVKLSGDSPNVNPDFSCQGSKIQFGYLTYNSSNGAMSLRGGIDNWTVRIDEKKPCCGAISESKVTCEKGKFTYTFAVTNTSSQPIQYLLLSPAAGATYTISPNVVNLGASPLNPGQTTTVSVTVGNAAAGDKICLKVSLADKALVTCCTVETCFELPECPCLKTEFSIKCGQNGSFTLTVGVQNQTPVSLTQIFVVPTTPTGLNVSPQMVTLTPPLLPGQTRTLTLTITGVAPGTKICLRLSPLSEAKETCCSVEICFTAPQCPPTPTAKAGDWMPGGLRVETEERETAEQLFQWLTGVQDHRFYVSSEPPLVLRLTDTGL